MSDMGDDYREMKDHKNQLRTAYGINCPRCKDVRPKACASILIPGQRCRVDGYVDPRPKLTDKQLRNA